MYNTKRETPLYDVSLLWMYMNIVKPTYALQGEITNIQFH